MSGSGDRHKYQRQYVSGAQKRKLSKTEGELQQEEAKRSRSIVEFLTSSSGVTSAASTDESAEAADEPSASLETKPQPQSDSLDVTISTTSYQVAKDDDDDNAVNSESESADATSLTSVCFNFGFSNDIGYFY